VKYAEKNTYLNVKIVSIVRGGAKRKEVKEKIFGQQNKKRCILKKSMRRG
jgi:hypothetical protein